jgi:hypothetical protein
MSKRHVVALVLAGFIAWSSTAMASAGLRPRPSEVPPSSVETQTVPDDFQVFNDYASAEHRYSSARVVVHYVVLGIDAPPLNDDDADGVPDYVERVGDAADVAISYYERRGFRPIRPETGGPDSRPDLYISRFAPGSFGISLPATAADGGAFVAIANNLDPSATFSLASLYGTVAHELFHLVQFSYFAVDADPDLPAWVLEGSAAALETRVFPELDDIVSALQLRDWFTAADRPITDQTYGSQLLWRYLDAAEPRLLHQVLSRFADRPVAGEGRTAFATTFAHVTGGPFAWAYLRYAVRVASDYPERVRYHSTLKRGMHRSAVAPFAVHYLALATRGTVVVSFARRPASAEFTYRLESDIAGEPSSFRQIEPTISHGGTRLTFRMPLKQRPNLRVGSPLLIVTNGSPNGRLAYRVSVR